MPSWETRILIAQSSLPFGYAYAAKLGKLVGVGLAEKNIPKGAANVVASGYLLAISSKKKFLELLKFIENHGVVIPDRYTIRNSIAGSINLRAHFMKGLNHVISAYLLHLNRPAEFPDWRRYVRLD
jgi:hypothetical protein